MLTSMHVLYMYTCIDKQIKLIMGSNAENEEWEERKMKGAK